MALRTIDLSATADKKTNHEAIWAGVRYEKNATSIIYCLSERLINEISQLINNGKEIDYRIEFISENGFKYSTDSLNRWESSISAYIPYEISSLGGYAHVLLTVTAIDADTVENIFTSEPETIYFTPVKESESGVRKEAQTVSLALKVCRESIEEIEGYLSEIETDKDACDADRLAVSLDKTAVNGYKNAAESSKNAAAQSQQNAKTSEDNAKISEDNAKLSEDNAKASEDNAKVSEENAKTSEENAQDWYERTAAISMPTKTSELNNDGDNSGKRFLVTNNSDAEIIPYFDGTNIYAKLKRRFFTAAVNETAAYSASVLLASGTTEDIADFSISLSITSTKQTGIMLVTGQTSQMLNYGITGGECSFNLTNVPAGEFNLYAVVMEGPDDAVIQAEDIEVITEETSALKLFKTGDKTKLDNAASVSYVDGKTKDWRVIKSVTVENQNDRCLINTDSSGNAFSIKEFFIHIQLTESGEGLHCQIRANGGSPYLHYETIGVNGKNLYLKGEKCADRWITATTGFVNKTVDNGSGIYTWKTNYDAQGAETITSFDFSIGRNTVPDGTVIKIYGKDA